MDIVLSGAFLTRHGQGYANHWPSNESFRGKKVRYNWVKTFRDYFRISYSAFKLRKSTFRVPKVSRLDT